MKKLSKRSIISATFVGIAVAVPLCTQSPAAQAQTVSINGQAMRSGVQPIKRNGRTLVAMRPIFEGLGAKVQWDAKAHSITAKSGGVSVLMKIGSPYAVVDGKPVKLDQAPLLYRGSTMVPLRFVSEAMGAAVNYNAKTRGISINTDGSGATSQAASVTLSPDKQEYLPQEPIKLAFTAPVGHKGYITIQLLPADIPAGDPKINSANRLSQTNLWSKTQGELNFSAPKKLGTYEFRAQDSNVQLASVKFEVRPETPEMTHTLRMDKTDFKAKEKIPVHFTSVPFQRAVINLVRTEIPKGDPEVSSANRETSHNLWGKTQGTQEFSVNKPGTYEFRMHDGNGNEVAYSEPFTVSE